jgi:hypothetical protein
MKKLRTPLIYALGILSGVGIVAASVVIANDSSIPYEFKDGQVISADTLNDLFGRIKLTNEGFASTSELNGSWACTTYDFSGSSKTPGMPNTQFALDNATNLEAITQTWTFSNGGQNLSMDKLKLGGIANNYTNGCAGQNSFEYRVAVVPPYLALTGTQGCTNGNGYVLAIKRTSAYKFIAPVDKTVISCTAINQPPAPPSNLTATAGSGGVALSWTDNGGTPTEYRVLKKSSGQYSQLSTVAAGTTTYTDSTGSSGDLYRVVSVNNNGASLASAAALAQ